MMKNNDDDETQSNTTAKVEKVESPQATNVQCVEQQTPYKSPVASRTRSFSALRRSYMRKKQNKEADKSNDMDMSSTSTSTESNVVENAGENFLQEREKEVEIPYQVKEIDSSTCNEGNSMKEGPDDHHVNSNNEDKNDQYYKNKFHEMVQNLKQMQEQFSQAHQNTHKNITAYDAFIKELRTSLEQEKRKNATIEEELREIKERLLMTSNEIELAKTNEQQHNNRSISTACIPQEPSQSEESSQLSEVEDLEKTETSTLLAMIKFYAGLTGITLSADIPPSNSELIESFCCAYRPKGPTGHVMAFRLTHDKEFQEYEYSPSFQTPKRGEFLHKIPGHLKETMYFNSDQAQSFLSSLIKACTESGSQKV
ncbi:uncharacterized protein LOC116301757 [Actinia tenebrosa]|uniref:Uncharacterized protein LOC116301757 n=1 Tax=Actinia tenebrosa TaxID=6105 RepID=A0A6P8IIZ0_ACTTE|nr:uncharacterized protein LOC116301757 [Actinia tenebrosa]